MSRKKLKDQDKILSHNLVVRVSEAQFAKLDKLRMESDCQSVAEVVRRILANQKILCFYKDISMNGPMEELALIRKELKSIGININQQTHRFHISETQQQRAFYVLKTAALYQKVDKKVDTLLAIVSRLAEKWLQK